MYLILPNSNLLSACPRARSLSLLSLALADFLLPNFPDSILVKIVESRARLPNFFAIRGAPQSAALFSLHPLPPGSNPRGQQGASYTYCMCVSGRQRKLLPPLPRSIYTYTYRREAAVFWSRRLPLSVAFSFPLSRFNERTCFFFREPRIMAVSGRPSSRSPPPPTEHGGFIALPLPLSVCVFQVKLHAGLQEKTARARALTINWSVCKLPQRRRRRPEVMGHDAAV